MTIQITSVRGSAKGISYQMNDKGLALELDRNGVAGMNASDINYQMRMQESRHTSIKNHRISFVISPSKEANAQIFKECRGDQEKLREYYAKLQKEFFIRLQQKQREAAARWEKMEQQQGEKKIYRTKLAPIDIENQSFISHLHRSTDDWHVHVTLSRANYDGGMCADSHITTMSNVIANEMCKERGWRTAKEISEPRKEEYRAVIQETKATNFKDFEAELFQKGFEFRPYSRESTGIYGGKIIKIADKIKRKNADKYDSITQKQIESQNKALDFKEGIKLSSLGKGFQIKDLQAKFEQNKALIREERFSRPKVLQEEIPPRDIPRMPRPAPPEPEKKPEQNQVLSAEQIRQKEEAEQLQQKAERLKQKVEAEELERSRNRGFGLGR